jgi:hypothetical protein
MSALFPTPNRPNQTKIMKNWSIIEARGQRDHVAAEIKANSDVPDEFKTALLAAVAGFMPEFNGVRVDAHAHEIALETPIPPDQILKLKDKSAPHKKTTSGMLNIHISISAVKLSAPPV